MTGFIVLIGSPFLFLDASNIGTRYPSERKSFKDPITGYPILAITTHPASDIKIYQTHPQWTRDGTHIIFRSNRTGSDQYFAYSENTGEIVQLTRELVGKVFVSRKTDRIYYVSLGFDDSATWGLVELDAGRLLKDSAKGEIADSSAYRRVVARFDSSLSNSGGFSLDSNEDTAYIGMQYSASKWRLDKVDLSTGETSTVIDLPWRVGHVQVNPWKPGEILYCHETGGDAPQRMWLVNADGSGSRPLYEESPTEWVTHEVWVNEDTVLFNLGGGTEIGNPTDPRRLKPTGIVSINVRNNAVMLHDQLPVATYWHCAAPPDMTFAIGDSHKGDLYYINLINGGRTQLAAMHLPKGGRAHPHQNISPDGKRVLFGSALFGNPDLMILELPRQ